MKLLSVNKIADGKHKYAATFLSDNGRKKTTKFGAVGMDDYTLTQNKEQRSHYRTRHAKDLKTNDPTRAGYLAYHILWGDSTSIATNIAAYKRKFNL